MQSSINFKKEIVSDLASAIERVTIALQGEGFGVLTRIDKPSTYFGFPGPEPREPN